MAHSKTVIGVLPTEKHGFIIVHSIPKYPAFIGTKVNMTINTSELIYGQHALCMTVPLTTLETMAISQLIIRPNVYHATVGSWSPSLYNLGQMNYGNSSNTFENHVMVLNLITSVKSIYKNNMVNSSIF